MKNNYDKDPQFREVMSIFPIVKAAVDTTDDPVVFGTTISSVIQIWAQERGIDPKEVVSDMVHILGMLDEQEDEDEDL